MKDYYISMFQYEQWANQQIVNILQPNDSININLMFHLESAKHIWLSRIENFKRTLRVFEDADIEKLIFWQNKNTQDMNHFLEKLTQQKLDQMISYFNSERKTFENSVSDIIIQLIHHSKMNESINF